MIADLGIGHGLRRCVKLGYANQKATVIKNAATDKSTTGY